MARRRFSQGSSITNNFRFPGQYYDAETELHQNWHRYYMPAKGRYLTPDSIGLAGGMNLYAYANGNPANLTDFMGLFDTEWNLTTAIHASHSGYSPFTDESIPHGVGSTGPDVSFTPGPVNHVGTYDAYEAFSKQFGYDNLNHHPTYKDSGVEVFLNASSEFAFANRGVPDEIYPMVNDPVSAWTEQIIWTMVYPWITVAHTGADEDKPPLYPAFQPPDDSCP